MSVFTSDLDTASVLLLLESIWTLLDQTLSSGLNKLVVSWAGNSLTSSFDLLEVGGAIHDAINTNLGGSSWALLKKTLTVNDSVLGAFTGDSDAFLGLSHGMGLWTALSDTFLSFDFEVFWAFSLDTLGTFEDEWLGTGSSNTFLVLLVQGVVSWAGNKLAFTVLVSLLVSGTLSVPTVVSGENESSWAAVSLTCLSDLLESRLALEVSAFSVNEKLGGVTDDSEALLVLEDILVWTRLSDTFLVDKVEVLWT